RVLQVIDQLGPSGALGQPGAAAIDGNAHNPRFEWTLAVPAAQTTENTQKHFLRHILGIVTMIEQTHAQAKNFGLESADQQMDGLILSTQAASNQSSIVVRGHGGCS